jgi:hypothetical protein
MCIRRRRLARSVGRGLGLRHFTSEFARNIARHMSKCISTARVRTKRGSKSWTAIFSANFRVDVKLPVGVAHRYFDCRLETTGCHGPGARSLHEDLANILHTILLV